MVGGGRRGRGVSCWGETWLGWTGAELEMEMAQLSRTRNEARRGEGRIITKGILYTIKCEGSNAQTNLPTCNLVLFQSKPEVIDDDVHSAAWSGTATSQLDDEGEGRRHAAVPDGGGLGPLGCVGRSLAESEKLKAALVILDPVIGSATESAGLAELGPLCRSG